tara:strand:- start:172 stop:456 length:285 start_codon:yes stop_codon:yes gene_type:complete
MYNFIENKDKNFKDLAIFPGFNITNLLEENKKTNDIIKINTLISNNKDVIEDKIFIKFYSSINESNNKSSRKRKIKKDKKIVKNNTKSKQKKYS